MANALFARRRWQKKKMSCIHGMSWDRCAALLLIPFSTAYSSALESSFQDLPRQDSRIILQCHLVKQAERRHMSSSPHLSLAMAVHGRSNLPIVISQFCRKIMQDKQCMTLSKKRQTCSLRNSTWFLRLDHQLWSWDSIRNELGELWRPLEVVIDLRIWS